MAIFTTQDWSSLNTSESIQSFNNINDVIIRDVMISKLANILITDILAMKNTDIDTDTDLSSFIIITSIPTWNVLYYWNLIKLLPEHSLSTCIYDQLVG